MDTAAPPSGEQLRFGFGKNWQRFVGTGVDEERIRVAGEGVKRILRVDDLRGRSFLDVGCGSGLSSLAACRLGADCVVGFDYDRQSVEASKVVRDRAGVALERWEIVQGSILDADFLQTLTPADVVYSWGVLHHTGAMWPALDNCVRLVRPGGLLAIALYNRVERRLGGSAMWWRIKRLYNQVPRPLQAAMVGAYGGSLLLRKLLTLQNPVRFLRTYGHDGGGRGMDFWHDARDWVGGFPYEYATAGEVFTYMRDRHGFELIYLDTHDGHVCNEFTFRRPKRASCS